MRIVAGVLAVLGGVSWILLDYGVTGLTVGLVAVAAGLLLIRLPRRRPPWWVTAPLMAVAAVAGTLAGRSVQTSSLGGMFVVHLERGWPFPWQTRSGVSEDPETARQLALAEPWWTNELKLVLTALFWATMALVIVLGISGLRSLASGNPSAERNNDPGGA